VLEQPRIRLLDAPVVRIEDVIEPFREIEAIEQVLQASVRVRHHDQLQAAVAQCRERRRHIRLDVLPQVVLAVILAKFGERRIGAGVLRHAGVLQHEVEIEPAALAIVGRADGVGVVDVARRLLFGGGERRGGDLRAMTHHRLGDAGPRRVAQHAPGIEKRRFDRAVFHR